jgi:hypothetical protein
MTEADQPMRSGADSKPEALESLHPVWRAFIRYCAQMRHGEIERLCIQDGLPVLAESTTRKVKFTR